MVNETELQSSDLLYEFTANLVKVFKIRGSILGKLDLQKTVYFMKRLGIRVPFEFRWNLLGPYSYEFAHYCTYLEIKGLISYYSGAYQLNDDEAKKYEKGSTLSSDAIDRVKRFFDNMNKICEEKNYDKVLFVECAASLDFINQNITTKKSKEVVFSLLEKLKPEKAETFRKMREDAWKFLKNEELVN